MNAAGTGMRRIWIWAGCAAALASALALLRPWVIVPLHGRGTDTAQTDVVDAAWQRLLAGIDTARAIARVHSEPAAAMMVHARGVLAEVNTASMNGWARVELPPADGAPRSVVLHLGPVVRGTALRDAAGLSYDDFDTQVTYARAASALNERAMQALERDGLGTWIGRVIVFTGVATPPPADGIPIEVVPLRLALEASP